MENTKKFVLFASYNCGISYYKEQEADTLEELRSAAEKLDVDMIRWYIEENGKQSKILCGIHKSILSTVLALNAKNQREEKS